MRSTDLLSIATPATLLALAVAVGGCSNSREDVRLTLCKGVTEVLLGSPGAVEWRGHNNKTGRFIDLEMTLNFEAEGGAMQAVCFYEYHEPLDDNAINDSQPLAVYSTRPYRVVLNGEAVSGSALNSAINGAVLKQGKEFAESVQKGVEGVTQKLKEEFEKGRSQ